MNVLEAVRDALAHELERDERVMVLGQDVGQLGGVFRATEGLRARFGEDRVIDMPLAEAAIVGSSVGLALSGLVPVAEIQFLGFTQQAFHQIGQQLARYRYRSQGRRETAVTIRTPFGGGVRTPEFHSDAIQAQFVQCPGLKIVTPSTPSDTKGLLLQAIRSPDPVLFCEPLATYRTLSEDVPEGDYTIPFGEARLARAGDDVTLIAWSAAVQLAERAADALAEEGISCRILDLRTLVPLDVEALAEHVAATGRAVVIDEAPLSAGFAAEVVATVQEEAFYSLQVPVLRVTSPDTPYPLAGLEAAYLPTEARVVAAVRRLMAETA